MERVAKRFLLHNNRESEEVKESDFDELKQDIQMTRLEMLHDLKNNKENLWRYTGVLHRGLCILGEVFSPKNSADEKTTSTILPQAENMRRFLTFRAYESQFQLEPFLQERSQSISSDTNEK